MKRFLSFGIMALAVLAFSVSASARVNEDIFKWIQPPDLQNGFDQQSQWDITDGEPDVIKADDWICPDGRPISDIHWWGSYYNNEEFQPNGFYLNIYDNNPAISAGPEDDLPGTFLTGLWVDFSIVNQATYGYDSVNEMVYEYTVYIPEEYWFHQEEGTKYWLSIVADTPNMGSTPIWGWHTGFQPDIDGLSSAVTGKVLMGDDWARGNPEMWEHEDYNLAFALTTIPEPGTIAFGVVGLLSLLIARRRNK